jgi:hypothetical protein
MSRYPSFYYTSEGKEVRERLWEETIKELNCAGALGLVENLKGSAK